MKRILFIGDVVGKAGCNFVSAKLGMIKQHYGVDITVINGENSAQGNGISRASAQQLIRAGADVITTGNHAFRRKNDLDIFEEDYIIRPANYPEGGCIGRGACTLDMGAYSVAVVNLMGTVYMDQLDNPFTKERIADLKLSDSSLSISGNMPSHPRHIVNPHTGTFVEDKKMVSVVAKDPVVAEILTTAFMICGDERVPVIASQFDIYEKHVYKL